MDIKETSSNGIVNLLDIVIDFTILYKATFISHNRNKNIPKTIIVLFSFGYVLHLYKFTALFVLDNKHMA